MKRLKRLRGLVMLIALLAIAVNTGAATIIVPDDYLTIQEAIDAAEPGDTVYVKAGRYVESLSITKPLRLVGEERTRVIIGAPDSKATVIHVNIGKGAVTVEGVLVQGGEIGIRYEGRGSLHIKRCIVGENKGGVVASGANCRIAESYLWGNQGAGIFHASLSGCIAVMDTMIIGRGMIGMLVLSGGTVEIAGCLVGLVDRGVEIHTTECGWEAFRAIGTLLSQQLQVTGSGNRVHGFDRTLCPGYLGKPWPEGFLDEAWGQVIELAIALHFQGQEMDRRQEYQQAAVAFEQGLALLKDAPFPYLEASFNQNIGVVRAELGQYEEALAAFQAAREVFAAGGMNFEVAEVDGNIGNIHTNIGRYEEALSKYRAARDVFAARGMEVDVAKIDVNIGVVYMELGRYEEALSKYRAARDVFAAKRMDVEVASDDVNIGLVYRKLGRYKEALKAFRAAREVFAAKGMDDDVAKTDGNIANVYDDLCQYDEALAAYAQALAILDRPPPAEGVQWSYPATRWVVLFNMGLCYEKLGQKDQGVASYSRAIAVVESLRGYYRTEELKVAWGERTRHVYERLIDLLYRMGEGSSAFTYAERCRARTFLDALYQGSIAPNQLISPEAGISSGAVDPIAIDQAVADARNSLQSNEAVLEYMVTDSGVYLWVITKEEIGDPSFIKYEREQLMNDVITLRQAIENSNSDTITVGEFLISFYDKLVKESLAKLSDGVDTLILIPSGPLWYLPFSALMMTDRGVDEGLGLRYPYLVEHYTLAYLPSLASLSSLATAETQSSSTPFMALANPTLSAEQIKELGTTKYQYAQLEDAAEAIRQRLAGQEEDVYVEGQAREPQAYQETPVHTVEFYGCHGAFNPKVPLQSKLFLGPGESGESSPDDQRNPDGNYHAWEALLTDHRGTELVILGACESLLPAFYNMQNTLGTLSSQTSSKVVLTEQQLKQIVVGDEVVGLARAFLSSGAEAVLGTLWQANPGAIKELLVSMCEYHNQSYTWVQALTKAQRELIKDDVFKSPWLWAPYQLIGRWR